MPNIELERASNIAPLEAAVTGGKIIKVVAAVIYNETVDQVLIARRPDHLHQGGLWEFPGGKMELGESPQTTLARELQEELNILPTRTTPLMCLQHSYPEKTVELDIWQVKAFDGEPNGNEGQEVRWVKIDQLVEYAFPAANKAIVERVCKEAAQ